MSVYIFKELLQPAHIQVPNGVRNLHIQIPAPSPTIVTSYVDPDASGTNTGQDWLNAFASLSAADAANFNATSQNLVANNETVLCLCRSSVGTADTSSPSILNFVTDATHVVRIQAASGHEALKTGFDVNRYRLTAKVSVDNHVILDGLQIDSSNHCIATVSSSGVIQVLNCYLRSGVLSSGIYCIHGGTWISQNTIIYDSYTGIWLDDSTLDCENCVIKGGSDGLTLLGTSLANITNCAVFDSTGANFDIGGTATAIIDHCASDDGNGTNAVAPSGSDWDNEFVDSTNGDFTLLNTGNLYRAGTAIAGLDTDIDGDTWADPPSIGIDENVGPTPFAQYLFNNDDGSDNIGSFDLVSDGTGITYGAGELSIAGKKAIFDGTSTLRRNNVSILYDNGVTTAATACGWFYTTSTAKMQVFCNNHTYATDAHLFQLEPQADADVKSRIYLADINTIESTPQNVWAANVWNFWAIVFDNPNYKIYFDTTGTRSNLRQVINHTLISPGSAGSRVDADFFLGARHGSTHDTIEAASYFTGSMQDIRFYDSALTVTELENIRDGVY